MENVFIIKQGAENVVAAAHAMRDDAESFLPELFYQLCELCFSLGFYDLVEKLSCTDK